MRGKHTHRCRRYALAKLFFTVWDHARIYKDDSRRAFSTGVDRNSSSCNAAEIDRVLHKAKLEPESRTRCTTAHTTAKYFAGPAPLPVQSRKLTQEVCLFSMDVRLKPHSSTRHS